MKPHSLILAFALSLLALCAGSRSEAQIAVLSELSFDRQAAPGQTYEGRITLKNEGTSPTEVKVYQTDYSFSCDRTTRYDDAGTTPRSNAGWITFRPARAIVPAGATIEVHYAVSVPPADTAHPLLGSYWSMLMIEEIGKGSPESSVRENTTQMGLAQVLRYGIQIATHIAGTGKRAIEFRDIQLTTRQDSTKVLEFSILNTGTLWIRPSTYVEIFDSTGASRGRIPGKEFRLYPSTCSRQSIGMPQLPPGGYKALLVIDAGGDEAFGAEFKLTF